MTTDPLLSAVNGRADHNCFGCGDASPHGLRLKIFPRDGGGVFADWVPGPTEEGYVGLVHGGLITTVLDEVMAWSCYADAVWGMTASISVRFRRPVEVGGAYRAEGWVVSSRGRVFEVASSLSDARSGGRVAEATARFIRVTGEQAEGWTERYGGLGRADRT